MIRAREKTIRRIDKAFMSSQIVLSREGFILETNATHKFQRVAMLRYVFQVT